MESDIVVIRQDQANLKSQMEDSNTGLQKLQEDLLRLEEKMAGLEKNRTAAGPAAYKIEQTTPAILYEKARNRVVEEKYLNAATLFTQMIRTYPKDSLADNAMYWLGECHYSLGKYQKAISVFKDLVTLYPKSEKVPDAILKTGYSYFSLGDSAEARQYLKQVLKEYPFSLSAEKAQEKLGDFD